MFMVGYDPKRWWRVFFSWSGTVLPAVLGKSLAVGLLTLALTCMYQFKVFLPPKSALAASDAPPRLVLSHFPEMPALVHTVIGFVVGLLIVFRTNSSYDRFWEGRKLWGSIVNH